MLKQSWINERVVDRRHAMLGVCVCHNSGLEQRVVAICHSDSGVILPCKRTLVLSQNCVVGRVGS